MSGVLTWSSTEMQPEPQRSPMPKQYGEHDIPGPHLTPVEVPEALPPGFSFEALATADARPLALVGVQRVYRLDVDKAHFPPAPYNAAGSIQSWWTRLASIPCPDAQVGDEVEIVAQVQFAGYHFFSSAWTPTGVTITHGEPWPFDSQVQLAGYRYGGRLCLPFPGENINNRVGGYYRPHRFCPTIHWDTVDALPYTVNVVTALSCNEVRNETFLDVYSAGGQSAVFVKLYRRR